MLKKLSELLYDNFVVNKRYYALQTSGIYYAKKQPINKNTIFNVLKNKESFLCYQEDFNKIKWICFDFDINKHLIENGEFKKNKKNLYIELFKFINILINFLKEKDIDYLLEFSGNRGIHLWILFNGTLSRQEGYIILDQIIKQSSLKLDDSKFSLDKYPKSYKSTNNTDKGTGVKIPLSYHQKSKKYSYLFKNFNELNIDNLYIENLDKNLINIQIQLLQNYKKLSKKEIFEKLNLSNNIYEEYETKQKNIYLKAKNITFNEINLEHIKAHLSNCEHLAKIFKKNYPNEKERRIIVGLFSRLRFNGNYIGKDLLFKYFMSLHNPIESIIKQRLNHSEQFFPPTCDFFRNAYNVDCKCKNIKQTPLEYLENFSYEDEDIFEFDENIFKDIKKAQIKYTIKNDEIPFIHTLNILKNIDYIDIKEDIENFIFYDYSVKNFYIFQREEKDKIRNLFALKAKDKIITTFFIKVLDNALYPFFSSRSYGYRFNSSFRQNNIFEEWLKQWNLYIGELKSLIYNEDFQDYYILKVDIRSFYDSINNDLLEKLLNEYIELSTISNISEKNILKKIVFKLIEINKKIVGQKGIPQGPAYARYLAEIFLSPLDREIEKHLDYIDDGYYFRYVDDFFIILPTQEDVNKIQETINRFCTLYNLNINEKKYILSVISDYKDNFQNYVNETKYFIDKVEKSKNYKDENTLYNVEHEILNLIYDNENKIIDKNLSFIFTHFTNSQLLEQEKEKLIDYVIKESKNRGSFYYHFWKYFFERALFENIDFLILKDIKGLKRESFLHYLLLFFIKNKELPLNSSLIELLNFYIKNTELSANEQLLLLSIHFVNNIYVKKDIISIIKDEKIFLDIVYSNIVQKTDNIRLFEILKTKINSLSLKEQLNIWSNIIFYNKKLSNNSLNYLIKEIVNILSVIKDIHITQFLKNKTNISKIIQLMYIVSLFIKSNNEDMISKLSTLWKKILINLKEIGFKESLFNEKYFQKWIKIIQENKLNLEDSNLIVLLNLIGTDNKYEKILTKEYYQYKFLFDYFFNKLLILLLEVKDIDEDVKRKLIVEKKVLFLKWLEERFDLYPNKEMFLYNALFNDILVFKKENKIYYRIFSNLKFKEYPEYLTFEKEIKERLFNGKYKYIILNFEFIRFKKINFDEIHIVDFLKVFKKFDTNREIFTTKLFHESKFLNINEDELFTSDKFEPLNIYDYYCNNFIYKQNQQIINKSKNLHNYIKLIFNLINQNKLITKFDDKIYGNDFKKYFFPFSINGKYEFLLIFASNIEKFEIINKYDLEYVFIKSLIEYMQKIEKKENINFFELLKYYFEVNRKGNNYSFFYKEVIKLENFESYLNSIVNLLHNDLRNIFNEHLTLIKDYIESEYKISLDRFVKYKIDLNKNNNETIINFNNEEFSLEEIKIIKIDGDEIKSINLNEPQLNKLRNLKFIFGTKSNNELILIKIPELLIKMTDIVQNMNEFKPKIEVSEIVAMEYFGKAIEVLKNHWDDEFNGISAVKNHLVEWLKPFNKEEIEAILYVISEHIYFNEEILRNFKNNLNKFLNDREMIITLKKFSDFNGTHLLIEKINELRKFKYILQENFVENILSAKKRIIIVIDNIISGNQTLKCFKYYFGLSDEKEETFFEIDKEKNEHMLLKRTFAELEEIVFLTAIYTDKGKEEILNFFESQGIEKTKILFVGKELEYDKVIFKKLNNIKLKNKFIEICQNENLIFDNFKINNKKYYKYNSELKEDLNKLDNRNMLVRLNSVPKKAFWLFRIKPKYYDKSLFNFREIYN